MKNQSPFRTMGLVSAISSQLVGAILIGIFAGKWVDKQTGMSPLFLIIGLFLGLAVGVYALIRLMKNINRGE